MQRSDSVECDHAPWEASMREAMRAAEQVRGSTSPNPPVGCVLLDSVGHRVATGATQPPGGPHAEIVALEAAGERARGGTAVVTLEPCAHQGRTPACADALVRAGVARVVYAVSDPHAVAAGGAQRLAEAGVDVQGGLFSEEVRLGSLRAWLHFVLTGRPHVTWKYAATLDGRSAAADGTSRWISSAESRAEVHELRAQVDAIVAGTGTVLADDPHLTARDDTGRLADRQPLRVVLGQREVPPEFQVRDAVAETLHLRERSPRVALAALAERGIVDVLLEGGPTLAGAFLEAECVDRVLGFLAPALLGAGENALGEAGVGSIAQARWLQLEEVRLHGTDIRISAVPRPHSTAGDHSDDET